jgi:hypothetical protein
MWIIEKKTHRRTEKGHVETHENDMWSSLVSPRGLAQARYLAVLFCDMCCLTSHQPAWKKPRHLTAVMACQDSNQCGCVHVDPGIL